MVDGDPAAVEAHLRRLRTDALAALVSDLWAARGYETAREGNVVTASRGEHTVTIASRGRSRLQRFRSSAPSADVVVVPGGASRGTLPDDVRVLDATDLREMLWYALDPETARGVCERHLGAPPSALSLPLTDRVAARVRVLPAAVSSAVSSVTVRAESGVALVAALAVLVGVVAVGGTLFPADVFEQPFGDDALSGLAGDAPTESEPTPTAAAPSGVTASVDGPPPSWVTSEGDANVTALAAAHDRMLANRSYTIWMDVYRPPSPNASQAQWDVDVAVSGERYLLETTLIDGANRTPVRTVYYDGSDWYVATWTDDGGEYRVVPGNQSVPFDAFDPFVLRRSLVTRYLTTPTTNVSDPVIEDRRLLYRITGYGTPVEPAVWAVSGYTVTALVDRRGLVHDLSAEYQVKTIAGSTPVRFEVTYGQFDQTTVTPPGWYETRFGNRTVETPAGTPTETPDR